MDTPLSDLSIADAIIRCGELQLHIDDVVTLMAHRYNPHQLRSEINTPGSDPHRWYQQGIAQGNLMLNIDLEENVSNPKSKDAYKHLAAERRRQAINKKLDELF